MDSAAAGLLLAAAVVFAMAAAGAWYLLKRPARELQRRQRDEALAAAAQYTPAPRASAYGRPTDTGASEASDPCAPGLSDGQRVVAMRKLLLQGQGGAASSVSTTLAERDESLSTSPMAWNPTLPPDEAELVERQRAARRPRVREADHEHITIG